MDADDRGAKPDIGKQIDSANILKDLSNDFSEVELEGGNRHEKDIGDKSGDGEHPPTSLCPIPQPSLQAEGG